MSNIFILLVEDMPDIRALMQFVLESAGFVVVAKEDGAEALSFLHHSRPDVILTDLMMPRVSGIELIEQVRANSELADIPIIAMTAYSSGPVKQAKEAGANLVLKKPVDVGVVSASVRSLCRPLD